MREDDIVPIISDDVVQMAFLMAGSTRRLFAGELPWKKPSDSVSSLSYVKMSFLMYGLVIGGLNVLFLGFV